MIASAYNYEDACLRRLAETLPTGCRVTILADRGFGDQKLFAFLETLGFGYVVRFRGNIHVTAVDGRTPVLLLNSGLVCNTVCRVCGQTMLTFYFHVIQMRCPG